MVHPSGHEERSVQRANVTWGAVKAHLSKIATGETIVWGALDTASGQLMNTYSAACPRKMVHTMSRIWYKILSVSR
jgi:Tfp pilus tip-associated adhesin PilY1